MWRFQDAAVNSRTIAAFLALQKSMLNMFTETLGSYGFPIVCGKLIAAPLAAYIYTKIPHAKKKKENITEFY